MTPKELRRLHALHDLTAGGTQANAAARLGLSVRQVKRLVRRFREEGEAGLLSRKRGRCGNRKRDPLFIARAIDIVRERYADFGPTFASEKLREVHDIRLDRETLRKAMIEARLWKPKRRRSSYHPPRERRPQFGELVQIDGSPHAWFENRAPKCTLIVFIDDATSRLVALQFVKAETTAAYFAVAKMYFEQYGLPLAFYSDRYSVFRLNTQSAGDQQTQFGRAMDELDIALICANSPQAKGRVERANRTLQDRLVKELRLAGIASMEAANAWLPSYIFQHNERFASVPAHDADAHRFNDRRLESILISKFKRKLSKDMTFQHRQSLYAVQSTPRRLAFPHATIELFEPPGAAFVIERNGHSLEYRLLKELTPRPSIASGKDLEGPSQLWRDMPQMARPSPPRNHPWRRTTLKLPPIAPKGDISNLQDGDITTLR